MYILSDALAFIIAQPEQLFQHLPTGAFHHIGQRAPFEQPLVRIAGARVIRYFAGVGTDSFRNADVSSAAMPLLAKRRQPSQVTVLSTRALHPDRISYEHSNTEQLFYNMR